MIPDQMAQIHAASFTTPRPWSIAEFAAQLANPLTTAFTHANGFALIRAIAGEAELLTLATDPAHRRQGIASQLITQMHQHAHSTKTTTIFLEVAANNHAAQALYTAHGYRESGRRPAYYRTPDGQTLDAILMEHRLT